jgi:hypothetical protein
MFDGLSDISGFGWLVIVCALALGFGCVKFMIEARPDRPAQNPPAAPDQAQPKD